MQIFTAFSLSLSSHRSQVSYGSQANKEKLPAAIFVVLLKFLDASDPYVVATLDRQKEKTNKCRDTVDPQWDYELKLFAVRVFRL